MYWLRDRRARSCRALSGAPRGPSAARRRHVGAQVVRDRPAHHAVGEGIDDRAVVDRASRARCSVIVVSHNRSGASAVNPRRIRVSMGGRRWAPVRPLASVADPRICAAHQPGHGFAAAPHPTSQHQLGLYPRRPVGAARAQIDRRAGAAQVGVGVGDRSNAGPAMLPAVARAGEPHEPAGPAMSRPSAASSRGSRNLILRARPPTRSTRWSVPGSRSWSPAPGCGGAARSARDAPQWSAPHGGGNRPRLGPSSNARHDPLIPRLRAIAATGSSRNQIQSTTLKLRRHGSRHLDSSPGRSSPRQGVHGSGSGTAMGAQLSTLVGAWDFGHHHCPVVEEWAEPVTGFAGNSRWHDQVLACRRAGGRRRRSAVQRPRHCLQPLAPLP